LFLSKVFCSLPDFYPPTDSTWRRSRTSPVLSASQPWEGIAAGSASAYHTALNFLKFFSSGHACVCENVALYDDASENFVMFYRGGWASQAVGRASSTDGVNWTKYEGNPV
jgi:hypothetical protein